MSEQKSEQSEHCRASKRVSGASERPITNVPTRDAEAADLADHFHFRIPGPDLDMAYHCEPFSLVEIVVCKTKSSI